jgi:hypothetical protein
MTTRSKPAPMAGLVRAKPKNGVSLETGPTQQARTAADDPSVALNFTVPRSFRRRFKRLALELDVSQVELLRRAFELLERESGPGAGP